MTANQDNHEKPQQGGLIDFATGFVQGAALWAAVATTALVVTRLFRGHATTQSIGSALKEAFKSPFFYEMGALAGGGWGLGNIVRLNSRNISQQQRALNEDVQEIKAKVAEIAAQQSAPRGHEASSGHASKFAPKSGSHAQNTLQKAAQEDKQERIP